MKKAFLFFLLIVVTLTLVASCAAPQPSAPSSTGTKTVAPAGPKTGGTLRLALTRAPNSMDVAFDSGTGTWLNLLFNDNLVDVDGSNITDLKVAPRLAKSWNVSPDGFVYTFNLREGVKWQNIAPVNGRELVADDFKYMVDRIMDVKTRSPKRGFLTAIDRAEAPDKYTFKLILKSPDPGMFLNLVGGSMAPVPREIVEKDGNLTKTFVGTGAFILEQLEAGVKAVFRKNPDYWDKGKPYLDKIEVFFTPEPAARLAAFRAGQIDRLLEDRTIADSVKRSNPEALVVPRAATMGAGLRISITNNPKLWGDVKVRQAVQYAIDYDALIQLAQGGEAKRTDFVADMWADWGAITDPKQMPQRDIVKAKALLAEAGYPNGFKTTMLMQASNATWGPATEPLVAQLKDAGIDAAIETPDDTTLTSRLRAGQFDLAPYLLTTERPLDIDRCFQQMYHSAGGTNLHGYKNTRVDELIDLERKTIGQPDIRKGHVKELLVLLRSDLPAIPLYYNWNFHIVQSYIKGWERCGSVGGEALQYVSGVWINK